MKATERRSSRTVLYESRGGAAWVVRERAQVARAFLLDTAAVIWWMQGSRLLPSAVQAQMEADGVRVFVSAVSLYEIAQKHRRGLLDLGRGRTTADVEQSIALAEFAGLPVTLTHARRAGELPSVHKDPFDRLLAAQAIVEDLTIVSPDPAFDLFAVPRLW